MNIFYHTVNVDSQARTTAQDNLQKAEKDLFMQVFAIRIDDSEQTFF